MSRHTVIPIRRRFRDTSRMTGISPPKRRDIHQAIVAFFEQHEKLGSCNKWASLSGLRESTVRPYCTRNWPTTPNPTAETLFALAYGASKALGRRVSITEMIGDYPDEWSEMDRRLFEALYRIGSTAKREAILRLMELEAQDTQDTLPAT